MKRFFETEKRGIVVPMSLEHGDTIDLHRQLATEVGVK
jgi:hypothetical protein